MVKLSNRGLTRVAEMLVEEGFIDGSSLDSKNKHAGRDVLRVCLESYMDAIGKGYRQVLQGVQERWGQKRLGEFVIDDATLDKLRDGDFHGKEFNGALQESLHYSDEAVQVAYDLAVELRGRGQWTEAASIFVFLLYLDPRVSWFWQGLGDCWQQENQWEAAQFAYGTAVNCDPTNPQMYRSYCNCFLEMGEKGKAQAAIEWGLQVLQDQPKSKENSEATTILQDVLAYLKSIKSK